MTSKAKPQGKPVIAPSPESDVHSSLEAQAIENATAPPQPPPEPPPLGKQLADDLQARRRLETQLKVTFFLTLIVGLTGGAFGDWVIPTISVCAYAVIGWMITRDEENIDRFADSLYYMGFLFTMWGLLFAFGPWTRDIENLSSKNIITQFGIKLITTVIALTARIILIQARVSLAEMTEETRETLGALAKTMTREIEESIAEFRKSRDRLLAEAEKGAANAHTEVMRQLTSTCVDVHRQMQKMLDDVQGSTHSLLAQITAINVPSDILATPLDAAAQSLVAEMQRLQTNIHQAGAGITKSLSRSFDRVQQATGRMDAAVEGLKGFELLASETKSAAGAMATANAALQETFEQTSRLLGELARVVAKLQHSTNEDVTKIRDAIESTTADIRDLGNTLTESVRVLRGEIERA